MDLGFNKHLKLTEPVFWVKKNTCFPEDGVNEAFLGPKSTFLYCVHYIFLKLYLIAGINDWLKATFLDF